MKFCLAIVSYNRYDMLVELLTKLKECSERFHSIYVINNNSSDRRYYELDGRLPSNCTLHNLSENTGGSGGFRFAIELFLNSSEERLMLLDDDVDIMVENLVQMLDNECIGDVHQLRKLQKNNMEFNLWQRFDMRTGLRSYKNAVPCNGNHFDDFVNVISFEGVILSRVAAGKLRWPRNNYFISDDDTLAGLVLKKAGFKFNISKDIILRKKIEDSYPAPWKMRYIVRNHFLLFDDFHELLNLHPKNINKFRYFLYSVRRFAFLRKADRRQWHQAVRGLFEYFRLGKN